MWYMLKNIFKKKYKFSNNIYPKYINNIIKDTYPRCKIIYNSKFYTIPEKDYIIHIFNKIKNIDKKNQVIANNQDEYVDMLYNNINLFISKEKDILSDMSIGKCFVKNTMDNINYKCLFLIDWDLKHYFIEPYNKNFHTITSYIPYRIEF